MPKTVDAAAIEASIARIAREHFHQLAERDDPLATQHSDRADFIDTAVWAIRAALEDAYSQGWVDAEEHHKIVDDYDKGMAAAINGEAYTTNPHTSGTQSHDDWTNGFSDAGGNIA
jgi:hypothetical protein